MTPYPKVKTEIQLCPDCDGWGQRREDYCTDYHKREYDTRFYDCKTCLNSGRVKVTITTTMEPCKPKGKTDR